jgi:hypothetical protein
MAEPVFMKVCIYIMAYGPISTALINPSHQSVYPPIVTRQRLGKNVSAVTNTQQNNCWSRFLCDTCRIRGK